MVARDILPVNPIKRAVVIYFVAISPDDRPGNNPGISPLVGYDPPWDYPMFVISGLPQDLGVKKSITLSETGRRSLTGVPPDLLMQFIGVCPCCAL